MPKPLKHNGRERISSSPPRQKHLIWILFLLTLILPVLSWELASKTRPGKSNRLEHGKIYESQPGPWGALEYVRISIELPDHFVNVDDVSPTAWFFKGSSHDEVMEILKKCGLSLQELESLTGSATWKTGPEGCHVLPTDDSLWALSGKSRAQIYSFLAQFPENVDQFYAFTYRPEFLEERFEMSGLKKETIALFNQLLYPQGTLVRFADTDLVLRKLADKRERLRFVKTITRRSTLLIRLKVDPQTDIDSLVNYWGIGGRAKDLKPLVESLSRVQEGCKIDIAHLLPPFARQRIYTFPPPAEETSALKHDCHWTSLNFFKEIPDDGYDSLEEVQKEMELNLVEVGEGTAQARFGDVLFLKNSQEMIVHSAVYIADDVVFTKNGTGLNQPWIYMRVEDMLPYYVMPNDTLKIVTYRRKTI